MKTLFTVLLIILPSFYFGFIGKPTEMGLAIVTGALAGAFLNLDKFERFKGAGFEAEMKKEFQKAVDEAYATIDNLKELAKPLLGAMILSLTNEGRFMFGNPDFREKDYYKDQIIDVAKSMDLLEGELLHQIEDYHAKHIWDLFHYFIETLHEHIYGDVKPQFSALYQRGTENFPDEVILTELFKKNNMQLDENSSKKLKTYLHYLKNKSFKGID
jgi:hypothetical protein